MRTGPVYAFILIQIFTTLPAGGVGAFAAIVIKGFGYSTWETQLLQMVRTIIPFRRVLAADYHSGYRRGSSHIYVDRCLD